MISSNRRPLSVAAAEEAWPLARPFVISRGARTEARVVVVRVSDGGMTGWGEATPYARYGETIDSVVAAIHAVNHVRDREELAAALPPGAARNAFDCAFWDLEAKRAGTSVHAIAGLRAPQPVRTAYTLSLDAPDAMAAQAREYARFPLLKLKLGGEDDEARMRAVRAERPDARLIADANEAWTRESVERLLAVAKDCRFELVEQPLPQGRDDALPPVRSVPVCADESIHGADGLPGLAGRYDAVNIKLDKTGGLTHALETVRRARELGFKVMAGSMLATSLSMAPALLLAQDADWADLDSPALLARDREGGLTVSGDGWISPAAPGFWG